MTCEHDGLLFRVLREAASEWLVMNRYHTSNLNWRITGKREVIPR
jgi:hypothetical protein